MHLWLSRCLLNKLSENLFGDALRSLTLKSAFATEAMTFDPPKTLRHQLIRSLIMLFCLFMEPKISELNRQSRLNAVRIGKMRQRILVHFHRAFQQTRFMQTIRRF